MNPHESPRTPEQISREAKYQLIGGIATEVGALSLFADKWPLAAVISMGILGVCLLWGSRTDYKRARQLRRKE